MTVEFRRDGDGDAGTLEIICDGPKCYASATFDGGDFHEAMGIAKEAGWKNMPGADGDWTNLCPSCGGQSEVKV